MDCTLIEPELIGFHFATLDEPARARVEQHLCGCVQCLRAFVALKRAIECQPEAAPPSELARARLRAAVARRVRRRARPWVWLSGAAAAAVVAFMLGTLYRAPGPASPSVGGAVDSARAVPASFNVL